MNEQLTPDIRRALSQRCNGIFADPNASSADVLEAMITYMTINSVRFETATGEFGRHLQAGANALRELAQVQGTRRFLGMPRSTAEQVHEALQQRAGSKPCPVCSEPGYNDDRCEHCGHGEKGPGV